MYHLTITSQCLIKVQNVAICFICCVSDCISLTWLTFLCSFSAIDLDDFNQLVALTTTNYIFPLSINTVISSIYFYQSMLHYIIGIHVFIYLGRSDTIRVSPVQKCPFFGTMYRSKLIKNTTTAS